MRLTPSGLQTETQEEIVAELTAALRAVFGPNLNTTLSSGMGQIINVLAEARARDQQIALELYRSLDPSAATGVTLDQRAAYTGSTRDPGARAYVGGTITFLGAGTAPDGTLFQNDDTLEQWRTIGGPYTATGPATLEAVELGERRANGNTAWSVVSVVPGLTGFSNSVDANPGRSSQSDPEFRVSRQVELYARGLGGRAAIRGAVSRVPGVLTAAVYHNPDLSPSDADGIPFKALNVVVETDPALPDAQLQQAIAEAIFSRLGAGGQAYGTSYCLQVQDIENNTHDNICFDVVTGVDAWVNFVIDTTDAETPVSPNLAATVQAYVLEQANLRFRNLGRDQTSFEYIGLVSELQYSKQISGVTAVNATVWRGGGVPGTIAPVGKRERPRFSLSRILVSVV